MSTNPARPDADADASTLEHLADELETLRDRVASLEADRQRKAERIEDLETQLERTTTKLEQTTDENDRLEDRVAELEQSRTSDEDRTPFEARLDAHAKKLEANKTRLGELQARELEKGAHLRETNVDPSELELADSRLERIRKDDGNAYVRVPESDDPLERGGTVSLAHGDLLPIQQLARMDEDMLRSTTSSLPSRLAAKLWKARADSSVGDNPWRRGSKEIREYVTAGDMKHWIRRKESGVSDSYAKKLVSRTIDALLELSKNRLAITKKRQRKNGLEYTERRVLLTADAEIPGENTLPA